MFPDLKTSDLSTSTKIREQLTVLFEKCHVKLYLNESAKNVQFFDININHDTKIQAQNPFQLVSYMLSHRKTSI